MASVVIIGNLSEGFRARGPYADHDQAAEANPGPDVWIMDLEPTSHIVSGSFETLMDHVGHQIAIVYYSATGAKEARDVAVECEDCGQVLVDFEKD